MNRMIVPHELPLSAAQCEALSEAIRFRPRGAEVVRPRGCSMLARVDHELAARVKQAKLAQQLAEDARENEQAPVTFGTRTWE